MSNHQYACLNCNLPVQESLNSIYCDICCHWYHVRCSTLPIPRIRELGNDTSSGWFCKECLERCYLFKNYEIIHSYEQFPYTRNKTIRLLILTNPALFVNNVLILLKKRFPVINDKVIFISRNVLVSRTKSR